MDHKENLSEKSFDSLFGDLLTLKNQHSTILDKERDIVIAVIDKIDILERRLEKYETNLAFLPPEFTDPAGAIAEYLTDVLESKVLDNISLRGMENINNYIIGLTESYKTDIDKANIRLSVAALYDATESLCCYPRVYKTDKKTVVASALRQHFHNTIAPRQFFIGLKGARDLLEDQAMSPQATSDDIRYYDVMCAILEAIYRFETWTVVDPLYARNADFEEDVLW